MASEIARIETDTLPALSVAQVGHRMQAIQALMREQMESGLDYGTIPGTGSKPTLLQPGAQKLLVMFQLDPQFATVKHFQAEHLTVETYCTIYHAPTGTRLGGASAMCSTREKKYAWRAAELKCPECGKASIIKGKEEYGGGWLCWKKKDGCGAKFEDGEPCIESQPRGRVANEDVADSFNTVVRMSEKRALVAAVRLVTGASAVFDEEAAHVEAEVVEAPRTAPTPKRQVKTEPVTHQDGDRSRMAATAIAIMQPAKTLEELRLAFDSRPKGLDKIKDEHLQEVLDFKDGRKLSILANRLDELRETLGFDDVQMGLACQQAGLSAEPTNADEATKLITVMEKELEHAGAEA